MLDTVYVLLTFIFSQPERHAFYPNLQIAKSGSGGAKELAQLVSGKAKIGIQVHLTLKPIFFLPHHDGQNYL